MHFNQPYLLAMANAGKRVGKGTNGSQFFITVGADRRACRQAHHLRRGRRRPSREVVDKIADVPTGAQRPPVDDVVIESRHRRELTRQTRLRAGPWRRPEGTRMTEPDAPTQASRSARATPTGSPTCAASAATGRPARSASARPPSASSASTASRAASDACARHAPCSAGGHRRPAGRHLHDHRDLRRRLAAAAGGPRLHQDARRSRRSRAERAVALPHLGVRAPPATVFHILFNMYALWHVGQYLEPLLGRAGSPRSTSSAPSAARSLPAAGPPARAGARRPVPDVVHRGGRRLRRRLRPVRGAARAQPPPRAGHRRHVRDDRASTPCSASSSRASPGRPTSAGCSPAPWRARLIAVTAPADAGAPAVARRGCRGSSWSAWPSRSTPRHRPGTFMLAERPGSVRAACGYYTAVIRPQAVDNPVDNRAVATPEAVATLASAPAGRHHEAGQHQAEADAEVPAAERRDRVLRPGDVERRRSRAGRPP